MRQIKKTQLNKSLLLFFGSSAFYLGLSAPTPFDGLCLLVWTLTLCVFCFSLSKISCYYALAWRNRPPQLMRLSVMLQLNPILCLMPPWVLYKESDSSAEIKIGPFTIVYLKTIEVRRQEYGQDRRRLTLVRRRDA